MKDIKTLVKSKKELKDIDFTDLLINYCSAQKITVGHFLNNNKDHEFTRDRKIVCYLLKQCCKTSLEEISKKFNRSNHSSISVYISWVKSEYKSNEGFRNELNKILDRLCVEISK